MISSEDRVILGDPMGGGRLGQADEAAFGTDFDRFQVQSGPNRTGTQGFRSQQAVDLHVPLPDLFFDQVDFTVQTQDLIRAVLFLGPQPDVAASNAPEQHTEEDTIQQPARAQGILG